MIPCICIDDTGRPESIPTPKWVKKDEHYHITHIYLHPMQGNIQGVELYEKTLGEDCAPYVSFRISRFIIKSEDFKKLIELAELCTGMNDIQIEELLSDAGIVISD